MTSRSLAIHYMLVTRIKYALLINFGVEGECQLTFSPQTSATKRITMG